MYFFSNTYAIIVRKFQKVLEGLLEGVNKFNEYFNKYEFFLAVLNQNFIDLFLFCILNSPFS